MSNSVDNRAVNMEFNNERFERNIAQSTQSLEKLKSVLNFGNSAESLSGLQNVGSIQGLGNLADSVDKISNRFTNLGIVGTRVLMNLTDRAVDAGVRMTKSLTIDQVTAGWSKYEDKTKSVQTIMAATADDWDDQAAQMEFVSSQLQKLNTFTDETSYNFVDMTSNIGKFTSAGVKLDEATSAMMGIATSAALAGAGAQEASRAMYNFSQAMGTGSVKVQDWMSIENANMATKEFKQTIIETAKEVGTLDAKTGKIKGSTKGLSKEVASSAVTFENFRSTLAGGWFTSEVLTKALDKYGKFSVELTDAIDETGYSATELLKYIDKFKEGTLDISRLEKETGITASKLTGIFNKLGSEENALGMKAFKAAQEAKTLTDALEATKDAVSTTFLNMFETVFGGYLDAKVIWTDFANFLYDKLVEPLNTIQGYLLEWEQLGGRDLLFGKISDEEATGALYKLGEALDSILSPFKEAINEVFPEFNNLSGKTLFDATENFQKFVNSLILTEETSEKLKSVAYGLIRIVRIGTDAVGSAFKIMKPFLGTLKSIASGALTISAAIGNAIPGIIEATKSLFNIESITSSLAASADKAATSISEFFNKFSNENLSNVINFQSAADGIQNAISGIVSFASKASSVIASKLIPVWDWVRKNVFSDKGFESFDKLLTSLLKALGGLSLIELTSFLKSLKNGGPLVDAIEAVGDALGNLKKKTSGDAIKEISISLGLLAGAFLILSTISYEDGVKAVIAMTAVIGEMVLALNVATGARKGNAKGIKNLIKILTAMRSLAVSILVMAAALKVISTIDLDGLMTGLVGLTGILVSVMYFMKKMSDGSLKGKGIGPTMLAISIGIINIALAMKMLSGLSIEGLLKGIVGITAILVVLKEFFSAVSKNANSGTILAAASAITVASVGIIAISASMLLIGSMNIGDLGKGLLAITSFIALFGGLSILVSKYGDPGKILAMSGAIAVIGLSLVGLAVALRIIGTMDFKSMVLASTAMFVSLAAISGALLLMDGTLKGSAALMVASIAIGILAPSLKSLGKMKMGEIGKSLLVLAGSLVILGGAALILGPLAVPMLAIAGSIAIFGIGALATAVAINILNAALIAFPAAATGLIAGIGIIVNGIIGLADEIAVAAFVIITSFAKGLASATDSVILAVEAILTAIFTAIDVFIPKLADLAVKAILSMIGAITKALPTIINGLSVLVIEFLNGIADAIRNNAGVIFDAVLNIVSSLIELVLTELQKLLGWIPGIGDNISNGLEKAKEGVRNTLAPNAGKESAKNFTSGIEDGIEESEEPVGNSFAGLGATSLSKIQEYIGFDAGSESADNFASGLINGLNGNQYKISLASSGLANSALTSFNSVLDINSPSGETEKSGKFFAIGFINSIGRMISRVRDASKKMGSSALEELSSSFTNIDDEINTNPVITPVLDLSQIQNGSRAIGDMLYSRRVAASISGGMQTRDSDVYSEIVSLRKDIRGLSEAVANGNMSGIPDAIKESLSGMSVSMNGRKVGRVITSYQKDYARANGT